mgnify:CR=1 FL=1
MRRGMTLIELLLVLVIVVGLLAISVPGLVILNGGQRVNNAANSLAAALSQARARAMLDKRPHGIRLTATDPDNPKPNQWFDTIEFIALHPPLSEGYVELSKPPSKELTASLNFPANAVKQGDYLLLHGQGQAFRIEKVSGKQIVLYRDVEAPVSKPSGNPPQPNYLIYRVNSEPVSGLRPISFSQPVVVDGNQQGFFSEILFAPDGSVLRPDTAARTGSIAGAVIYWVARYEQDATGQYQTQQKGAVLVVVFPHSGRVATFPVNTEPSFGYGDPYYWVKNATGFFAGQ